MKFLIIGSAAVALVVTTMVTCKLSRRAGQIMAANTLRLKQHESLKEKYDFDIKNAVKGKMDLAEYQDHLKGLRKTFEEESASIDASYQDFLDNLK
jgi:hypothetical protein